MPVGKDKTLLLLAEDVGEPAMVLVVFFCAFGSVGSFFFDKTFLWFFFFDKKRFLFAEKDGVELSGSVFLRKWGP